MSQLHIFNLSKSFSFCLYKVILLFFSGTKHFLLMCNVRAEDSGEIKFVARHIESVAYLDVEGIISISKKYVLVVQCQNVPLFDSFFCVDLILLLSMLCPLFVHW